MSGTFPTMGATQFQRASLLRLVVLHFLPDTAASSLGFRRSTEGICRCATILVLIPMGGIIAAARRSVEEDYAKYPTRNQLSVLLSRTNPMSYHLGQITLALK
jgi:hypothetical protein